MMVAGPFPALVLLTCDFVSASGLLGFANPHVGGPALLPEGPGLRVTLYLFRERGLMRVLGEPRIFPNPPDRQKRQRAFCLPTFRALS